VWDTRTRKPLPHTLPGAIGSLASDGRTLPLGYGGDTVLMNAESGQLEATLPNTGGAPLAILSPDRRRIAVSEQVGTASVVVVYELTTKQPVGAPLRLHGTTAYPVGFLPDGRLVTSSHNEAAIWTLGKKLSPLTTEVNTKQDPVWPNWTPATTIFLPGTTHTILTEFGLGFFASPLQLHDAASGQLTGTLFNGAVEGTVAASPDGRLIAAGSQHSGVGIWNLQLGKRIARLTGVPGGYDLSWSPAGNLVAADTLTAVQLWNVSDPNHPRLFTSIRTATPTFMDYLLFSADGPDGKTVAVDSGDASQGRLTLLDASTGKPQRSMPLPSYGGVAYLHHGQWIIVTDDQANPHAELHDASTLQSFGAWFPTTDPDGVPIAVNNEGTIFSETERNPLLWNVDPADWIRTACTIAGRNLTQAEWRQYLPDRTYHSTCSQWPPGT
jgi:WD40 repeat protein